MDTIAPVKEKAEALKGGKRSPRPSISFTEFFVPFLTTAVVLRVQVQPGPTGRVRCSLAWGLEEGGA